MKTAIYSACVILALALAARARADEVIFNNGDRLTGTIKSVAGQVLEFAKGAMSKMASDDKKPDLANAWGSLSRLLLLDSILVSNRAPGEKFFGMTERLSIALGKISYS